MSRQTQTRIGFLTASVAVLAIATVAAVRIGARAAVVPRPAPAVGALPGVMPGPRDFGTSGACCELLPDRCFDYDEPDPEGNYVPVNTHGCTSSADCNGKPNCASPGDCICLPYYKCTEDVCPWDCPTDPNALSYRVGDEGSTCSRLDPPEIDPPCGRGLCCYGIYDCFSDENPLLCLGYIGQGDSWGGEDSACLSEASHWECPAACDLEYTGTNGHPNDADTVYLSDTTSNGKCEMGGNWCDDDGDCAGADVCKGEDEQIVADCFMAPEPATISELCWWGVYWDEDQNDCSPGPALNNTTFTIRFMADDDSDGMPDLPAIATYPDLVVEKSTSGYWANEATGLYEWEFHTDDLNVEVTPGTCYFVEIVATNSTPNCDFWWEGSLVEEARSALDNDADGTYDQATTHGLAWLVDVQVLDCCIPCTSDEHCKTDGLWCNGTEYCDLETNCCSHKDPPDCSTDGLFCNGREFCDEEADTCGHTGDPCEPPDTWCDEDLDTCGGPPTTIDEVQSCMDHGVEIMCLDIICDGRNDPPYDNIEPRLHLGEVNWPTLRLHCFDPVRAGSTTVGVSCTPNPYVGTATVVANGTVHAELHFADEQPLPDESCCTFTFAPVGWDGIQDVWTIVMLKGDVDYDCHVTTADGSSITQRLGQPASEPGAQYDVDRDCAITTADGSAVTQRLGHVAPCPCPCP